MPILLLETALNVCSLLKPVSSLNVKHICNRSMSMILSEISIFSQYDTLHDMAMLSLSAAEKAFPQQITVSRG